MCTVVVEVPELETTAVRLLAVRDEDPNRAWDAPGEWWPENLPGVIGVRDRRANGAWLAVAAAEGRLAVILNRAPTRDRALPRVGLASRGGIVLEAAAGREPSGDPGTAGFNLVTIGPNGAVVTSWDGGALRRERLTPGVHMLAHHDLDNSEQTPRIAAWLSEFRSLAGLGQEWREQWIALLARTARLPAGDDRAIIRDNTAHGYPTQSLLACIAEIGPGRGAVRLDTAVLEEPASWRDPVFEHSVSATAGPSR